MTSLPYSPYSKHHFTSLHHFGKFRFIFITSMKLLCLFVLSAAMVSSVGRAQQEETMSYSCCKPLRFPFDPKHQNIWSHDNTNFAYSINGTTNCTAPCKYIESGVMELEECVEVRLEDAWKHMDSAMEKTIHHLPQPCAALSAGNPGVSSVLLLPLIITGFVIKMIC